MKKLLLLIACVAMVVGCEQDNVIKEIEKPTPNTPVITAVLSNESIGVNQLVTIHATSVDQKGQPLTVDVKDNKGWIKGLLVPVDYRPSEVGDCKFDFTSKSLSNESTTITKTVKVLACDFMFGRWGDTKEQISKYEDGLKETGFSGYWYNYSGGKTFKLKRSYYFTDDKTLSKGKTSVIYTVSATDPGFVAKVLLLTDAWKTQIAELTKVYAAPVSNTFPSDFDTWTAAKQIQYIQIEIEKTKAVFRNARTEVVAQIHNYGNSNLGFNTETTYTKL